MAFTDLFLVRHGMRLNFEDPKWAETAVRPHDSPLSENGFRQARETGQILSQYPVKHIFSSPFLRTVQTSSLIAQATTGKFAIEQGLIEYLNPAWFGGDPDYITEEEVRRDFREFDDNHVSVMRPKYPESSETVEVLARMRETLRLLEERYDGCAVLVGHGASIAQGILSLLGTLEGISVHMCSITHVRKIEGKWNLVFHGVKHLSFTEADLRLN